MPAAFIAAGASLLGGAMQADATRGAGRDSAQATLESARLAAEAGKFRPVGITSRYGTSNFQFDPSGYVTGAGYNLAPELRGYQDRLMGLSERGLGQAEAGQVQFQPNVGAANSLFNLGNQYLTQSPEQTAQKYMESQYNLLAPNRERSIAGLRNDQFQKGRLGLSVGATGERPNGGLGLSATNPELEAYYNSIAQEDLQLAQQAEQAGQQRTAFGTGLFSTGNQLLNQYYGGQVNSLSPFTTYLGAGSGVEDLGRQTLTLGSELGGRSATAGGNVGQSLLYGGLGAAKAIQAGAGSSLGTGLMNLGRSPEFTSGIENYLLRQQEQAAMENPFGSVGFQRL
jgi:hypothetical protein